MTTPTLEDDFIRMFQTSIGRSKGLDDLSSWILARLFIETGEMAMADLAGEAGYSLASVSNKCQVLERAGCIVKRTRPGTRKVYVYAHKDLIGTFMRQLEQIRNSQTLVVMKEIPPMIERYQTEDLSDELKEKIALLQGLHDDMKIIDKIITGMLERLADVGGARNGQ
jgi:DNA-binding transcriptional regulator GbsR (MarR family)